MLLLPHVASSASVLAPGAAAAIKSGELHFEEGFMPPRLVHDLRQDIEACAEAGLFTRAGSAEGATRSAEYCDPIARDRSIGDFEAFYALWERLDMVRQELSDELGIELQPEMEIHYVSYADGGFYGRHVDDQAVAGGAPSRRAVSFIAYLTAPSPPWSPADGGQLRVYADAGTCDYQPESGALAMFDSTVLEHEVLPTRRERKCLIGWFHTPAAGGGGEELLLGATLGFEEEEDED